SRRQIVASVTVRFSGGSSLIAAWVTDYNKARPHSALGYQTPAGFALYLNAPIAQPTARDGSSARRAIAQPAPKGANQLTAPVAVG
ncbi:MAG TPA: integrase core domain-containing protein, partial [Hyphomonas sp.]|nr:integrase core domain-containing protein [Hyphomonas sp.]